MLTKQHLVSFFEDGCKGQRAGYVGTEYEQFLFQRNNLRPAIYDGDQGIKNVLEGFVSQGWQPIRDGKQSGVGPWIGATHPKMGNLSIEPGGQFEFSGLPVETIHQTKDLFDQYQSLLIKQLRTLNLGALPVGFIPKWTRADLTWMPKQRYAIMRHYMPKRGSLGHDMMLRTCTVQANLDYMSEADMVKKTRVSMALQPMITALYANSPFTESKPNHYQSYRSHVWEDTDPDRCGMLSFVFDQGFGFEAYVDYLLQIPMYFIVRDGTYLDRTSLRFLDAMNELGDDLSMDDWELHTSTVFPEVRLKKFLEMRGADSVSLPMVLALAAFWVGILYDQDALDQLYHWVQSWDVESMLTLRHEVPKHALQSRFHGRSVWEWLKDILSLAHKGLQSRQYFDLYGNDESIYLQPLWDQWSSQQTIAETMLKLYHHSWNRDIDALYHEYGLI